MTPRERWLGFRTITIAALIMAAICVPIVVSMQRAMMPSDAELKELDQLVSQAVSAKEPGCSAERLSFSYRVGHTGDKRRGYFTYEIRSSGATTRALANWEIKEGHVILTSMTYHR
jgi:hypothetical protein